MVTKGRGCRKDQADPGMQAIRDLQMGNRDRNIPIPQGTRSLYVKLDRDKCILASQKHLRYRKSDFGVKHQETVSKTQQPLLSILLFFGKIS